MSTLNYCTFVLCKFCYQRNFSSYATNTIKYKTSIKIIKSSKELCFICKNLFYNTLPQIIIEVLKFQTTLINEKITKIDIGTSIPSFLYENEDYLRSIFKIKGLFNIKHQLNSLIREKIGEISTFFIDNNNPEIKFEILIDDELKVSIKYQSKRLILLGRYNKFYRGIEQRRKKPQSKINQELIEKNESLNEITVEDCIKNLISRQLRSDNIKITWTGSEDKNSLVLGIGRPFIVKINNPHYRFLEEYLYEDKIRLIFYQSCDNDVISQYNYKIRMKILVKIFDGNIENIDLEKLESSLVGDVKFLSKNKINIKKIYNVNFKKLANNYIEITLILDNGLPIKQLIGGEEFIDPCVSNLIGKKCECIYFDIEDII